MSVKKNDLVQFIGGLQTLTDEVPEIMTKIAVGEGVYAVKQARLICTNDSPDIVNTGDYRRNWKSDQTAKRAGRRFIVRFYNPLDYAGHLEHGFRSHFVPGHWDGKSFVYQPKDPQGGMFVHSLIPGHYTLERAVNATKRTQDARLQRRFEQELKKRGYMKYFK